MSADLLREAATLIRERALDATPGPWTEVGRYGAICAPDDPEPDEGYGGKLIGESIQVANRAHLAYFGVPSVAFAVADLLDKDADLCRLIGDGWQPNEKALAVARAYLGRAS